MHMLICKHTDTYTHIHMHMCHTYVCMGIHNRKSSNLRHANVTVCEEVDRRARQSAYHEWHEIHFSAGRCRGISHILLQQDNIVDVGVYFGLYLGIMV